jgi:hypothetical protein
MSDKKTHRSRKLREHQAGKNTLNPILRHGICIPQKIEDKENFKKYIYSLLREEER